MGFDYHLIPLTKEKIEKKINSSFHFPSSSIYMGYTTNYFGYGINNFLSEGAIPVFWGGYAHIRTGISLNYQKNIFRAKKIFSMDWCANAAYYLSKESNQSVITLSLNPVLKFNIFRTSYADLYFNYSVAGPTFISKTIIDEIRTGKKYTFHDFMGLEVYVGKTKEMVTGLRIAHYSNGNLFTENYGVKIPLTLYVGKAMH